MVGHMGGIYEFQFYLVICVCVLVLIFTCLIFVWGGGAMWKRETSGFGFSGFKMNVSQPSG